MYLRETAAGFDLVMESTPTAYQNFINKFVLPPDATDEQKALKLTMSRSLNETLWSYKM